jgi:hypothetical protein
MAAGNKIRNWLNTLNNDERGVLYADAGDILTQHGLPNLLQGLLNVGGLEDFALGISANLTLYNYFISLAATL